MGLNGTTTHCKRDDRFGNCLSGNGVNMISGSHLIIRLKFLTNQSSRFIVRNIEGTIAFGFGVPTGEYIRTTLRVWTRTYNLDLTRLRCVFDMMTESLEIVNQNESQNPIWSLPVEIIAQIFLHCLLERYCYPCRTQAPLLLCHICSRWRAIAMSIPQLWSNLSSGICLIPDDEVTSGRPNLDSRKQVQRWLGRARDSALSLRLDISSALSSPRELRVEKDIEETVIPCLISCRTLRLAFDHSDIAYSLLYHQPINPQRLEILILSVTGDSLDRYPLQPFTVFQSAPSLRRVSLSDIVLRNIKYIARILPWGQLTHLEITDYLSVYSMTAVLSGCLNLEQGVFSIFPVSESPLHVDVSLVNLEDLRIRFIDKSFDDHVSCLEMLNGFQIPTLFKLKLYAEGDFSWMPPTNLLYQFQSLRSLSLVGELMTTFELVDLLGFTDQLEELEIHSILEHDPFFISLTRTRGCQVLLPQLEKLTVFIPNIFTFFSIQYLIDMIRSRTTDLHVSPLISPLQNISVYVPQDHHCFLDDLCTSLKPWKKELPMEILVGVDYMLPGTRWGPNTDWGADC